MEYLDNTICLTYKEMLDCGIPMHTIKNLRSRKKLRQERRACKGVHALYSLDSLPLQYKVQVYERYPDLKERSTRLTAVAISRRIRLESIHMPAPYSTLSAVRSRSRMECASHNRTPVYIGVTFGLMLLMR